MEKKRCERCDGTGLLLGANAGPCPACDSGIAQEDFENFMQRDFARQENRRTLILDVISFGLCFMSWGAVFGVGSHVGMGIFGALIGANVWYWVRRRNYAGVKMISTVGGMGCFFAIVGVIVWIVKAII